MRMKTDRRTTRNRLLETPEEVLNDPQIITLNKMEGFGWMLAFIRRPLFQDVIPVLRHPDCNKLAVLDADGKLNVRPTLDFRA